MGGSSFSSQVWVNLEPQNLCYEIKHHNHQSTAFSSFPTQHQQLQYIVLEPGPSSYFNAVVTTGCKKSSRYVCAFDNVFQDRLINLRGQRPRCSTE